MLFYYYFSQIKIRNYTKIQISEEENNSNEANVNEEPIPNVTISENVQYIHVPLNLYEQDHREIQYTQVPNEVYRFLRDVFHREILVYVNEVQQKQHSNGIIDDRSFSSSRKLVATTRKENEKMNGDILLTQHETFQLKFILTCDVV
jgi:hypothetical protein